MQCCKHHSLCNIRIVRAKLCMKTKRVKIIYKFVISVFLQFAIVSRIGIAMTATDAWGSAGFNCA